MLEIISVAIIFADWALAIVAMKTYISRIKRTDIMYANGLFWFVECATVIFALGYLWLLRSENHYSIVGLLLTIAGGLSILEWLRYGVSFDETGFWVIRKLGKKHRYEYKDILKISHKKTEHGRKMVSYTLRTTTLHFPDTKVSVDRTSENYFEFMEKVTRNQKEERKKERKEVEALPRPKKGKKKKAKR